MAKRHPEEDATRVAAARRCVEMFREDLAPGQWAECVAGRDDPDSFCDSNMTVHDAVAEFWPWQNRRANYARMNAVVRLASRLMVGEEVSEVDARAEVRAEWAQAFCDGRIKKSRAKAGRRTVEILPKVEA